jgi:glucose/arabinose dehydrogenase
VQSILIDNYFIYVYYTVEESYLFPELNLPVEDDSATVNRVSRWEVAWAQNIAVFGEDIIVDGIPSLAGNHQGGGMAFGPEGVGHLYISTGDGANAGLAAQAVERGIIPANHEAFSGNYRSQIKSSPNGKVLRVLLWNGSGTVGNPYYNPLDKSTWESRLYDYGYRNPFEISFDKSTSRLFVADVGAGAKEEITIAKPDGNAGWGKYEGFNTSTFSDTKVDPDTGAPFEMNYTNKPLMDYGHSGNALTRLLGEDGEPFTDVSNPIEGNSITGGIVLKNFGPYTDYYMFSDYTIGWLNLLSPDNTFTTNFAPTGTVSNAIDITQGPDGAIYVVTYFGDIHKITYEDTLGIASTDFPFNKATIIGYADMSGKKLTTLEYAASGVYLTYYEYNGAIGVKKELKLKN